MANFGMGRKAAHNHKKRIFPLDLHKVLRHIARSQASLRYASLSGRSSVVEHNLAKVGVVSSNLIARSNFSFIQ